MRSFSIQVGRLFGVEVRVHLTFLILPLFVFWTEYSVHGSANGIAGYGAGRNRAGLRCGPRGWAHAGGAAEGLIPKAVILLPLGGVTVFDESRKETPRSAAEVWKRDVRIALIGPLVNLVFAIIAAGTIFAIAPGAKVWKWPVLNRAICRAAWCGRTFIWLG